MKSGIADTDQGIVILSTELTYEPVKVLLDSTNNMTLEAGVAIATNVTDELTEQAAALLRNAAKNKQSVDVGAVSNAGKIHSAYHVPVELVEGA